MPTPPPQPLWPIEFLRLLVQARRLRRLQLEGPRLAAERAALEFDRLLTEMPPTAEPVPSALSKE